MGILTWVVLGLIAGVAAKFLLGERGTFGWVLTIVLGMLGAAEWRRKGLAVPGLKGTLTPHYGVYLPTRTDYVELLAKLTEVAGRTVFDLGTGTGVLAIAAAKALRLHVLASDIDPQSVAVARDNARLNGTGDLVETVRATGFAAPAFRNRAPFDLVLANILANPLREMATPMAQHLAPSALVILSGLLPHQAQGVIAAYRARGLILRRHLRIDG